MDNDTMKPICSVTDKPCKCDKDSPCRKKIRKKEKNNS